LSQNALLGLALIAWFAVLALAESTFARSSDRVEHHGDGRLVTNFGFGIFALVASLILPLANIGAAVTGEWAQWGLANQVELPWWAITALLLAVQSLAAYGVHRLMHAAPILWRIHRVHHSDQAVDVSTGLRNHPLELLLVVPIETAVVLLLGAPVSAVVAVQTLLAAANFWQHADIRLPSWLEPALRLVIITPRLHRLHHHPERLVHDSNYGDLVVWWDWLFGTLELREGRERVGLDGQVARPASLIEQICSPFYSSRGSERADMGTLRS
jgi:sterol desaturase/sphingolipid hydroxylase (fatty acid hydroxylase superfamily)